jgi:hypothetical protein
VRNDRNQQRSEETGVVGKEKFKGGIVPPGSEPALHPDLLTFTIQARTGQIVKIESVDSTGAHHELSDEEKSNLAKEKSKTTLEDVLEQAFEAGIACVLGDADSEDDPPESAQDVDLRRLLLRPLLEEGAAKRLMQSDVLSRAMLTTLIQNATNSRPGPRE